MAFTTVTYGTDIYMNVPSAEAPYLGLYSCIFLVDGYNWRNKMQILQDGMKPVCFSHTWQWA